jgi:tetratricopeptide (TPR) repeat protein
MALPLAARGAEVIKPLATAPNASVTSRRAYGDALIMQGFLLARNEQYEDAVATLEVARKILRDIDGLKMTDLAAAAAYAEATSWQVQALINLGRGDEAKRDGKEGLAVARQVLDQRPGHIQALRAQGLITSPLVGLFNDEMRLAEALAMSDTTVRAWREFVRVDPGNTISWSNLAVAHFNRADTLQLMGKTAEGVANYRAGLANDAQAPPSILMRSTLASLAGRLALLEADRGNRTAADAALVENRRLADWLVANTTASNFRHAAQVVEPELWRMGVAQAVGDDQRALEIGRVVMPKVDQLKPEDAAQRRLKNIYLRWGLFVEIQSAYALKDYATAERLAAQLQEVRKQEPPRTMVTRREATYERMYAALILSRLNRQAEAQQLIAPLLKFERELTTLNHDDPTQRLELALALYVAAVAGLGEPATQLAEAATIMDKLPPEMKQLRSTSVIRGYIADEQTRRRS